jgi:mono/diheme cytochrome c family protein
MNALIKGKSTLQGIVGVPPVTGRAFFGGGAPAIVQMDRRFDQGLSVPHGPHSEAAFAAALRSGKQESGRDMPALMPRYTLADSQLQAVAEYLKTLSVDMSPGVVGDTIHMATVIAPGVDPERRQAFISTLTTAVKQMNLNVMTGKRQKMIAVEERRLNSRRKWSLDIWELSGPSSGWAEQLAEHQREKPVFALVSGLAKNDWQPVKDFCESQQVGCWFPSVDLVPAGAAQWRYSVYFSAGIAIEAEVIARKLGGSMWRVVQLVGADPVARGAAAALRKALGAMPQRGLTDVDLSQGAAALQAALGRDEQAPFVPHTPYSRTSRCQCGFVRVPKGPTGRNALARWHHRVPAPESGPGPALRIQGRLCCASEPECSGHHGHTRVGSALRNL